VDLGFGSDAPLTIRGASVSPREVLTRLVESFPVEAVEPQDCDVLRVITTGETQGQSLEITNQVVVHPYRRWGVSAGALDTGTPLAIVGHMLANGEITKRGAHGPEVCVPPEPFLRELVRYDMRMTTERRILNV
jgi:saccharopine dehydrogenase-like NADP-dependent oxidoreductase